MKVITFTLDIVVGVIALSIMAICYCYDALFGEDSGFLNSHRDRY